MYVLDESGEFLILSKTLGTDSYSNKSTNCQKQNVILPKEGDIPTGDDRTIIKQSLLF